MTTTISPSAGEAPFPLQAGVGASPGFSAVTVRRAFSGGLQEGVLDSGAGKVTTNSSGLQLSIAANIGEGVYVKGDDITAQGLYYVAPHLAAIVETCDPADATNPRIDQVIEEVVDDTHSGGGANLARIRIVKGTATSGATLENRSGAAALPTSAIRKADILIPAGFAGPFVTATHIRDRRTWARGAFSLTVQTSGGAYTNAGNTTIAEIDATNIRKRIECSGVPIKMRLQGRASANVAATIWHVHPFLDGAQIDGSVSAGHTRNTSFETGGHKPFDFEAEFTPAAGSHLLSWWWRALTASGTLTVDRGADYPVVTAIEEVVRQNASND